MDQLLSFEIDAPPFETPKSKKVGLGVAFCERPKRVQRLLEFDTPESKCPSPQPKSVIRLGRAPARAKRVSRFLEFDTPESKASPESTRSGVSPYERSARTPLNRSLVFDTPEAKCDYDSTDPDSSNEGVALHEWIKYYGKEINLSAYYVLDVCDRNKLKRMDKYCALTVYGYIRNETDLMIRSIIDICLLFYNRSGLQQELGFKAGKWLDPSQANPHTPILKSRITPQDYPWRLYKNAYSKRICDHPDLVNEDESAQRVYRWEFEIAAYNGSHAPWNMIIGIWDVDSGEMTLESTGPDFTGSSICYALVASAGEFTNHTNRGGYVWTPVTDAMRPCRTGDIIEMTLDTKEWELSYAVNGECLGTAFKVLSARYKAAVTIDVGGNAIYLQSIHPS